MSLPTELYEVFKLDEGTMPGIIFENISGREVISIYAHIKECCEELSSDYFAWSNKLERDVEVRSFDNPAIEVVSGEVDPFCHYISTYSNNGLNINNVSIFLFPDLVEIFYDVRDIQSDEEAENILLFIKKLNSLCPNCTPFFAEESGNRRGEALQHLLASYLKA